MLGALAAGLSGGASSFGESMRDVLTMQQQQRQHEDRQRIQQQQLDAQWQRMMNDSEYRSTQARLNAENRQQDLQREHERAMERSRRDAERDRDAQERWEIQQSGIADRARQSTLDRQLSVGRELMRYAGQRPNAPDPSRYRPEDRSLYDRDYAAWMQEVERYDAVGRMMGKELENLDYDELLSDLDAMTPTAEAQPVMGAAIDPASQGLMQQSLDSRADPELLAKLNLVHPTSDATSWAQPAFPPVDVRSLGGPGRNQPQLTGTVSPWRQSSGTSNSMLGDQFETEVHDLVSGLMRQEGR